MEVKFFLICSQFRMIIIGYKIKNSTQNGKAFFYWSLDSSWPYVADWIILYKNVLVLPLKLFWLVFFIL